jgi:Tol biopolymer transport system component
VVSDGATQSETTSTVTVTASLQAAFVVTPPQAEVEQPITFDSSGSTGDISTFNWDFGDGATSTEPNPVYAYQNPGDYTVTLTLNSIGGEVSQASQPVTITAPAGPPADPVIAFASEREGNRQIYIMDANGANVQRITDTGGTAQQPSWSVNNEIVFSLDNQLFVMAADGTNVRPLSADGVNPIQGNQPVWSPDGGRVAFSADQNGDVNLFAVNADGSNLQQITAEPGQDQQPSWSPDGSRIVFATNRDGQFEIYVINADGSNPVRLTNNGVDDLQPAWSPDGGRIAFATNQGENNDREVFVMGADGSNPTRLTTTPGVDTQPTWSRDGTQIFFVSEREIDREIYAMGADGSNPVRLTTAPGIDTQPAYKP